MFESTEFALGVFKLDLSQTSTVINPAAAKLRVQHRLMNRSYLSRNVVYGLGKSRGNPVLFEDVRRVM